MFFNNEKIKSENINYNKKQVIAIIVASLGGKNNIIKVDVCATRVKFIVVDQCKVNSFILRQQTGAIATLIKNRFVQIVYGFKSTLIKKKVEKYLLKN